MLQCDRCLGYLRPHNPRGWNVAGPSLVLVFSLVFGPRDLHYWGQKSNNNRIALGEYKAPRLWDMARSLTWHKTLATCWRLKWEQEFDLQHIYYLYCHVWPAKAAGPWTVLHGVPVYLPACPCTKLYCLVTWRKMFERVCDLSGVTLEGGIWTQYLSITKLPKRGHLVSWLRVVWTYPNQC